MRSSRREFLSLSAAAMAVLTTRRLGIDAGGSEQLGRIGLQLYTVRTEMTKDVEATLAKVAAVGYQEVEFAGYFNRTPDQIRSALKASGLTAPSSHVAYDSIIKGEWDRVLGEAAAIGHQYVVVAWVDETERKTIDGWKVVAQRLNAAAEAARKAGLRLAYHNHSYEFEPLEGRVPYDVLLAESDPHLVLLEMDLYWVTRGGRDPLEYFAAWPGRIRMVHVKDSKGPPDHVMADVGAGTIQWAKILARHKQAGIEHYFVEHDEPTDPWASVTASYRYLRALKF